jgi:hypothetical protein
MNSTATTATVEIAGKTLDTNTLAISTAPATIATFTIVPASSHLALVF